MIGRFDFIAREVSETAVAIRALARGGVAWVRDVIWPCGRLWPSMKPRVLRFGDKGAWRDGVIGNSHPRKVRFMTARATAGNSSVNLCRCRRGSCEQAAGSAATGIAIDRARGE
jgi:hypothetical protein